MTKRSERYPLGEGFLAVFLVPFAFAPVDFAAVPFAEAFFEADAFVVLAFEELEFADAAFAAIGCFAGADFAAVFVAAVRVVPALATVDFAALEAFTERLRFRLSPPGRALPTALTASVAKSPTDPAILPAVLPTLLTTLPASGIGCSPFRRPSNGRSSPCCCRWHAVGGHDRCTRAAMSTSVVLIGDTHLPRFGRELPAPLIQALHTTDLILHVGDITEPFVLDLLAAHAPIEAVAGNNDGPELTQRLGHTRIVVVEEARIGMTHGHLGTGRTTPERARLTFKEPIDAIAFGHSHQPVIKRTDDTWLLNPGSPTDRRRQPVFSFIHLEVDGRQMYPELVTYEAWR